MDNQKSEGVHYFNSLSQFKDAYPSVASAKEANPPPRTAVPPSDTANAEVLLVRRRYPKHTATKRSTNIITLLTATPFTPNPYP